uniref:Uncharacterized protein n=1 Tax=Amphiprion percula TaxID=161767 RepID=A0A3P8U365_AMPPE
MDVYNVEFKLQRKICKCFVRKTVYSSSILDVMSTIYVWLENLVKFEKYHGIIHTLDIEIVPKFDHKEEKTHILIVEGFLFHTYRPLIDVSSSRNYTMPDSPNLFDGHIWPKYLQHKNITGVKFSLSSRLIYSNNVSYTLFEDKEIDL